MKSILSRWHEIERLLRAVGVRAATITRAAEVFNQSVRAAAVKGYGAAVRQMTRRVKRVIH
jgi:hypothetical protein